MTWVPIQESGLELQFDAGGGTSLTDSIVTGVDLLDSYGWSIGVMDLAGAMFRVTALAYTSDAPEGSLPALLYTNDSPAQDQPNEATIPWAEFTPSPVELNALAGVTPSSLFYDSSFLSETPITESYQFLVEVWIESPTPVGDPYVIRGTHRAIEGGDNPQIAWVRTESGKMDLSEVESITVDIQRGGHKLLTIPATGDAEGRVDFTVTSANIKQKLSLLGLFRLYVRADGRVIYTGLLEVLG